MVVNATLAAMAKHGTIQERDINVYQIASSVVNPLVFQDLTRLLYEHYTSSPCIDSKGKPIQVPIMKLFSSSEEFSGHLWKDAIQKSGLTAMASSNGKVSQKIENICRKSVEQAKYLAKIYEPYTFYGGRFVIHLSSYSSINESQNHLRVSDYEARTLLVLGVS